MGPELHLATKLRQACRTSYRTLKPCGKKYYFWLHGRRCARDRRGRTRRAERGSCQRFPGVSGLDAANIVELWTLSKTRGGSPPCMMPRIAICLDVTLKQNEGHSPYFEFCKNTCRPRAPCRPCRLRPSSPVSARLARLARLRPSSPVFTPSTGFYQHFRDERDLRGPTTRLGQGPVQNVKIEALFSAAMRPALAPCLDPTCVVMRRAVARPEEARRRS